MNRLWIFSYSTPSLTALPHTHFGEGIDILYKLILVRYLGELGYGTTQWR